MKTRMLGLAVLLAIGITTLMAQTETKEEFEVAGNCGMCKTRIEKAAKSVEGVSSAEWDKESKMIKVAFDSQKTDIHKVHMAIANVGHDTKMHKASDAVYDKLPGCCKYERMEVKSSE
jgi:mercuric ion binding protein